MSYISLASRSISFSPPLDKVGRNPLHLSHRSDGPLRTPRICPNAFLISDARAIRDGIRDRGPRLASSKWVEEELQVSHLAGTECVDDLITSILRTATESRQESGTLCSGLRDPELKSSQRISPGRGTSAPSSFHPSQTPTDYIIRFSTSQLDRFRSPET